MRGSIVAPVTAEERAATDLFLTSTAQALDWGRDGWVIAAVARRTLCK